ncbi:F-box protein SKIP5 [Prunus yedoensis var. nudiflora]|uniref:F-box protein SKIP5 n=1 Tax=Prunus yedoensis var. nudiflora TaxID=2094558 RepID=A0A314ZAA2_PRUYE|nr:F-box protein SKIP5 [Prunus yedoensis var. nudiflora]
MEVEEDKIKQTKWKRRSNSSSSSKSSSCLINNLDDGCLMHIFSFLPPIPDGFSWHVTLACGYELNDLSKIDWRSLEFSPTLRPLFAAARPGDTILIAAGGRHLASNIQIKKRLCLIGGGELPDETTLFCSRASDSALELLSTCKLANLTVKAELGCCLLHRNGRLTIEGCVLQCESNPLDHLSCPIVSTASAQTVFPSSMKCSKDGVSVFRTRIEGGAKAVLTSGNLTLQRVRVIYARTSIFFWFDVEHQ